MSDFMTLIFLCIRTHTKKKECKTFHTLNAFYKNLFFQSWDEMFLKLVDPFRIFFLSFFFLFLSENKNKKEFYEINFFAIYFSVHIRRCKIYFKKLKSNVALMKDW